MSSSGGHEDQSPKKGDPVLLPTAQALQSSIVAAFRRHDLLHQQQHQHHHLSPSSSSSSWAAPRWDGQHAAFASSPSDTHNVDEIKVYWPQLNENLRMQHYGLQREIILQEFESGELLQIPVGEYPDLNNVRQHASLQRTRSSSIKMFFGLSTKAEAGDDDDDDVGDRADDTAANTNANNGGGGGGGGGTSAKTRGRSPSGKVVRRNSLQLSVPDSIGGGSTPRTGSPTFTARKLTRSSSNSTSASSSQSGGSPRDTFFSSRECESPHGASSSASTVSSPESSEVEQPQGRTRTSTFSFSQSISSKLLGSGDHRRSIRYTRSFLSFRRRILVESVSPEYFRELTRGFEARASYINEKPESLLPKVVAMLRLSQQPARGKHKLKAYYVLTLLPFPVENHEQIFSLCLRGGDGEGRERLNVGPYSSHVFLPDADFAREHELLISTYKRVGLLAQLASDLGHLQHQGRMHFSVLCVATLRDPVLGGIYAPGCALGPASTPASPLPLDRRPTLPARHDLPISLLAGPNALLPAPSVVNLEQRKYEYYLSVHESTDGASSSSYGGSGGASGGSGWRGWFGGRVGGHEYTSRLLRFVTERVLIDGGEDDDEGEAVGGTGDRDGVALSPGEWE